MSKVDKHSLVTPRACGEVIFDGHGWSFPGGSKPVSRFETLRPEATCGFTFDGLRSTPDEALVAWFTDDDGIRWQLDEYGHLVESDDENEWGPVKVPEPLPKSAPHVGANSPIAGAPPLPAPSAPNSAGTHAPQVPE